LAQFTIRDGARCAMRGSLSYLIAPLVEKNHQTIHQTIHGELRKRGGSTFVAGLASTKERPILASLRQVRVFLNPKASRREPRSGATTRVHDTSIKCILPQVHSIVQRRITRRRISRPLRVAMQIERTENLLGMPPRGRRRGEETTVGSTPRAMVRSLSLWQENARSNPARSDRCDGENILSFSFSILAVKRIDRNRNRNTLSLSFCRSRSRRKSTLNTQGHSCR